MIRGRLALHALLAAIVSIHAANVRIAPARQVASNGTTRLSDQVQLDRLIDLAAARLGLDIQYEPRELQNVTITVRLQRALDDRELWALTNQLLERSGFATIQAPGSDIITVTRINQAPQEARLEMEGDAIDTPAGFVTILTEMRHADPKQAVAALRTLSSKPGGTITPVGETNLLMISDVRPRLEQILELMARIDVPAEAPVLESIPVEHIAANQLVGVLTAAVNAMGAIQGRTLKGKVLPSTDGDAVVLIAPPSEVDRWRELVARFDERQPVERRTYAPRYFPVNDVAPLLEAVARQPGPRGAGDQWQVITNDLTGTLIVTATPAEHEQIGALIERLDDVPQAAQRPVRTYPIRNRSVHEVLDILASLIEAGVLETAPAEAQAGERQPAQRTTREVLPRSATPGLPAPQQQPAPPARDARAAPQPEGFGFGFEPALTLTADDATNTLIAVGDPRRLAQLEALIRTLDVRQPQVMIEVLVLSLNESDELDLGVELEKMEVSGSTMINLASLFGLGTAGVEEIPSPTGSGGTALVLNPGDFRILVRALESINEGRALNIPKVLVNNNQQATLDSVLQQPFTSTNASDTIATTSFGGTQDAGTTVTVTPRIAEGDHLVLEFQVALSSFVGESSDPNIPPPRQQNNIESVATIPDGHTVVVGGLDATNDAEAVSQVPLLGSLPVIGEVFKNRSVTRSRSRFYVFMRVNIMRQRGFEDLKYASDVDIARAGLDDDWPEVEPRVIK